MYEHRPQLVADCLTILRAYQVQRQTAPVALPAWGSFEEWSEVVRGAVVFAGLPDPIEAHEMLAQQADTAASSLVDLVAGWRELCEWNRVDSCTTREAVEWLAEDLEWKTSRPGHQLRFKRLLDGLAEQCSTHGRSALPDAKAVGYVLRSFRGRVVNGEFLESEVRPDGGRTWKVQKQGA